MFISDSTDENLVEPISALPGQFKFGPSAAVEYLRSLVDEYNLRAVILFGVIEEKADKDEIGSLADAIGVTVSGRDYTNPVILAMQRMKTTFGNRLLLIADVCLCSYTSSGHCGIMKAGGSGGIPNAALSHNRLAEVAVSYARHGADVIAPSDMIEGRVGPMRKALNATGHSSIPIMSYAVKYCSAFYGPFRSAVQAKSRGEAKQAPPCCMEESDEKGAAYIAMRQSMLPSLAQQSEGTYIDRSGYQLHPETSDSDIERIVNMDVSHGAEYLLVKPSTCYLDVTHKVAHMVDVPVGVYHTSGEYCQLLYAAQSGALDLSKALTEFIVAGRRAGANFVISYFTPFILRELRERKA